MKEVRGRKMVQYDLSQNYIFCGFQFFPLEYAQEYGRSAKKFKHH